jgi:hypothetical protein
MSTSAIDLVLPKTLAFAEPQSSKKPVSNANADEQE